MRPSFGKKTADRVVPSSLCILYFESAGTVWIFRWDTLLLVILFGVNVVASFMYLFIVSHSRVYTFSMSAVPFCDMSGGGVIFLSPGTEKTWRAPAIPTL